jgi:hypothetical protein
MQLKTLLLLLLLTPLLIPGSYAQAQPEPRNVQNGGCGIEPGKFYQGALVLELMEAAEAEIDAATNEAFAEGYKAATLRYAPDAAAYKTLSETLRGELEAERPKNKYFWTAAGVSFAAGFLLHSLIGR